MLNVAVDTNTRELSLSGDVEIEDKWSSAFKKNYSKCIFEFVDFVMTLEEDQISHYRGFCISSFILEGKKEQYFAQYFVSGFKKHTINLELELKDYSFLKLEDCPLKIIHIPTNNVIKIDRNKQASVFDLKENELVVLHKIMDGLESSEIAETLGVSIETVKKYRKEILRKSKSKTFFEVISKYYKNINQVV